MKKSLLVIDVTLPPGEKFSQPPLKQYDREEAPPKPPAMIQPPPLPSK